MARTSKSGEIARQILFCAQANRHGAHAVRWQDRYAVGVPDISMGWAGVDWWLEAKLSPNEPTAQQRDWLERRALATDSERCGVLTFYKDGSMAWKPLSGGTVLAGEVKELLNYFTWTVRQRRSR